MEYQEINDFLGIKKPISSIDEIVELTRKGLPTRIIDNLAEKLNVSIIELSSYLHVSDRTIRRYKNNKTLPPELSDHLLQISKVYLRCLEVFEDHGNAVSWMHSPNITLNNSTPLELMDTYTGIQMVLDELIRIEHGVVS